MNNPWVFVAFLIAAIVMVFIGVCIARQKGNRESGGGLIIEAVLPEKKTPTPSREPSMLVSSPSHPGPDWSLAHCFLLSRFLRSRTPDPSSVGYWAERWKAALRESEQEAVQRLLSSGLLIPCGLQEKLLRLPATQLKQMLRDRQLKVSGRKDEMAARLCSADPCGMERSVAGIDLLCCSENGIRLANIFLKRQEEARQNAFHALQNKNTEAAISEIARFDGELGFPKNPMFDTPQEWLREKLRRALAAKPGILSTVDDKILEQLRVAAGMAFLELGSNWLPDDLETGLVMDNKTAVNMIISSVQSGLNLALWRQSGLVRSIRILGSDDGDSCSACKKLRKRVWLIRNVPELPHPDCTYEAGCRCVYVAEEIAENR